MPINSLIAQGIRPLGDELIGVQQTVNRNALANREMSNREADLGFDQQRYADAQARQAQMDQEAQASGQQEQARAFFGNAYKHIQARQYDPAVIANAIRAGKERGYIDPQTPEALSREDVDRFAIEYQVAPEAPVIPWEQSDEYKKLAMQGANALQLEEARARHAAAADARKVTAGPSAPARLPTSALRLVDEATQAIGTAGQSSSLIDSALELITSNKVKLGPLNNAVARGSNYVNRPDADSLAYASIKQTFEKLRANYMLLAKGVQTEGDAKRAWDSEIGENAINSNKLAQQQLEKARGLIDGMTQMQNSRIDTVYSNFGAERPQNSGGQVIDWADLK